jgi:hypothetical protein
VEIIIGGYIPGHTDFRKFPEKSTPTYSFQEISRNFPKFPKKVKSPITGHTVKNRKLF